MTEKQKDIYQRVEEYYWDIELNKEEARGRVIKLLDDISEKSKLEVEKNKKFIKDLLSSKSYK